LNNASRIRAYANCDDAYVAWSIPGPIDQCRGFALWRRREGEDKEPVETWVPWAGQDLLEEGHHKPSTVWPIQKLMWSDFAVRSGEKVSYQAVPMTGRAGSQGVFSCQDRFSVNVVSSVKGYSRRARDLMRHLGEAS
jgi:hypothetical protein